MNHDIDNHRPASSTLDPPHDEEHPMSTTDTTDTTDQTAVESTIDHFMSAWNATSADDRAASVRAAYAEDASLTDPLGAVSGHDEIVGFIEQAMTQFAGHRFERIGSGDAHNGYVRFGWRLLGPDGTAVTDGLEIAKLDDSGRFAGTLGFFGPLPA